MAILVLGGAGYIGSHAARALRRSGYEVVLYDNPSQSKFRSPSIRRASRSIPMASKLSFENALEAYSRAYGLRSASLRYFNAAGADESGEIGEKHEPETHLIPTGAGRLHRERTRVANLRVRLPDRGRDLPSRRGGLFPDKKETGRVGPVSEAPVAMRLHRTARLVQRMADVVHVRLFISRQQSVQRSEETCVSDAATMGPVSRFCAAVLMVFAT